MSSDNIDAQILTVNGNKPMQRIVRKFLAEIGYRYIEETTDSDSALESLRDGEYRLVISDWNIAPMNGLELLREIRADAQLKALHFIMISAESKTENVVAAKNAGVDSFIVKPFNAATLRAQVEAAIG